LSQNSENRPLTEEEKYKLEIYHDYDDEANRVKLGQLYGKVLQKQDAFILKHITGKEVLDVGAGYGLTTKHLREAGLSCVGIDPNQRSRECAQKWYGIDLLNEDIHQTSFADQVLIQLFLENLLNIWILIRL